MHREAYLFVEGILGTLPNPQKVVEFGSRYINGTVRDFFRDTETYVGVDIDPGPCVNVVMPAQDYKPSFEADMVICCEVLEHVDAKDGYDIVKNAVNILKNGGHAIFTAAYVARKPHSAFDGGEVREGEYYGNLTEERLRYWANQLREDFSVPIAFDVYVRDGEEDVYFVIGKDMEHIKESEMPEIVEVEEEVEA